MAPTRVAPCDPGRCLCARRSTLTSVSTNRPRSTRFRDGSGRLSTRSTPGAGVVGLPSSSGGLEGGLGAFGSRFGPPRFESRRPWANTNKFGGQPRAADGSPERGTHAHDGHGELPRPLPRDGDTHGAAQMSRGA